MRLDLEIPKYALAIHRPSLEGELQPQSNRNRNRNHTLAVSLTVPVLTILTMNEVT